MMLPLCRSIPLHLTFRFCARAISRSLPLCTFHDRQGDKEIGRTKVVNRNLNPEWDPVLLTIFTDLGDVTITCFDYDLVGEDDLIGEVMRVGVVAHLAVCVCGCASRSLARRVLNICVCVYTCVSDHPSIHPSVRAVFLARSLRACVCARGRVRVYRSRSLCRRQIRSRLLNACTLPPPPPPVPDQIVDGYHSSSLMFTLPTANPNMTM